MALIKTNLQKADIGFKTIFNKMFEETETVYDKVATIVPSSNKTESYHWMGSLPRLRKWVGDRIFRNIQNHEYTIKNEPFEAAISIDKYDIQDDNLGIYKPQVENLAQSAKLHPEELVFKTLELGFSQKCYDGITFFGSHKVGKLTYQNKSDKALTMDSYVEARTSMMKIKDDEGRTLRVIPNLLVVPPALEKTARDILQADFINGTSNAYKGTAEILVVPELSSDTAWFLLDTTKAIKPIIFQEREKPTFVSLTDDTNSNVFINRTFLYGVETRCNTGYGFWQMAYGSTGTA